MKINQQEYTIMDLISMPNRYKKSLKVLRTKRLLKNSD
jgi:hypothetical protein